MTQSAHASTPAAPTPPARLDGLRQRHEMLEARLTELLSHPSADDVEIRSIKREKLRVKEAMEGVRH